MSLQNTRLIIFTDLDGCLLNKQDYDWSAARPTLERLRQLQIPVVMNSSKTVAEMTLLACELGLNRSTFICENGSVIRWGSDVADGPSVEFNSPYVEVVGSPRESILRLLAEVKTQFSFDSFADLGLSGVMAATQLSESRAQLALQRQGTEPLLWNDTEAKRIAFAHQLHLHDLTMTKGGRFWHVAGQSTKGKAMQMVTSRMAPRPASTLVAAIGDSPIDQSMLDIADVPIGIPTATGLAVTVCSEAGIVPLQQGSAGWAEAVSVLLRRMEFT
ncbi:MAG: HAD-IIB family hydrolase [Fuerstiella sp.]